MDYNEHLVRHIQRFERSVERTRLPDEVARKLLSVLGCLEYQVELGHCPESVVRSLHAGMRAWLEAEGESKGLAAKLDECVASVLRDM